LEYGRNDDRTGDERLYQLEDGLADRVREVREDLYGPYGSHVLADALGIPRETWINYENGVTIPAGVILRLSHLSGASHSWLMTGAGTKYPQREYCVQYKMLLDAFLDPEDRP
jgi:hypothetical protein